MDKTMKTRVALISIADNEYSLTGKLMDNIRRDFPDWETVEEILPNHQKKLRKMLLQYSDDGFNYIMLIDSNGYSKSTYLPAAIRQVADRPIQSIPIIGHNGKFRRLMNFIHSTRKGTEIVTFPEKIHLFPTCYNTFIRKFKKNKQPTTNSSANMEFDESCSSIGQKSDLNTSVDSAESVNSSKTVIEIDHLQQMFKRANINKESESRNSHMSRINIIYEIKKSNACEVSDAIGIVKNIFRECYVRRVIPVPTVRSTGYVTAESLIAKLPFPLFEVSEADGYACKFEDGSGIRRVKNKVLMGNPHHEIYSGECVFINKSDPLPYGTNCVVDISHVTIMRSSENNLVSMISVNLTPRNCQNVKPIGSYIKERDDIINSGVIMGHQEVCLALPTGITSVRVYEKPRIGIFSIACQYDRENYAEGDNMMMLTIFKLLEFRCTQYGVVMDSRIDIMRALGNAFLESDIVVISQSLFLPNKSMLLSILEIEFNAVVQFNRLDIKNGKRTSFVTCTFEGRTKFVFTLPAYMHAIMNIIHILILPTLMYWMGIDNYEMMRLNVWVDHDIILGKRPQYIKAKLQYSMMHECPKAVIREPTMRSLFLDTSRDDLILQLPRAEGTRNILARGSIIQAILLK